jgi:hypothetical protein
MAALRYHDPILEGTISNLATLLPCYPATMTPFLATKSTLFHKALHDTKIKPLNIQNNQTYFFQDLFPPRILRINTKTSFLYPVSCFRFPASVFQFPFSLLIQMAALRSP